MRVFRIFFSLRQCNFYFKSFFSLHKSKAPFLKNISLPKCVNLQAVLHEIVINSIMVLKITKHNVKIVFC